MTGLRAALDDAVRRRTTTGWPYDDVAGQALQALAADGEDPLLIEAISTISSQFGLDPLETELLTVCLAAEQSVALHLLLGLVSGDDGPARPTVATALELAGLPPDGRSARLCFGDQSTLLVRGLVRVSGTDVLLSRRLLPAERLLSFVAGAQAPVAAVRRLLLDQVPVASPGWQTVAHAIEADERLVWVLEERGGSGAALACEACRHLDVSCLLADLARLPAGVTPPEIDEAVAELLLECGLTGRVLVLAGAERIGPGMVEDATVPVIAVSSEPWSGQGRPEIPVIVGAGPLSTDQRKSLWEPLLAERAADVADMPLSPERISMVTRHARRTAALLGEDSVTVERVRQSLRELNRGNSTRVTGDRAAALDDLVLPDQIRAEFDLLVDWARNRHAVAEAIAAPGGATRLAGVCALFSGPPGTGKTLAANILADRLGLDLYQVELSGVVDKYIGETEKNLEDCFREAESTNSVLFFDEADALFGSRSDVKDSKDRYANQEIAYLLQRVERFDGITVLASNLRGNIDPAFARRLHFMITFPEPDEPVRRGLWEKHLARIPTSTNDPVDLDRLARAVEMPGGNVRTIVLAAAHVAAAAGREIGMHDLAAAARREYVKLGRRPPQI